ncbi:YcaO-like family protein [Sphingomonas sp.]|uniref:YcaO-like family protein n=1 Tax=Sphingomonas sp. TaxID=28214 RepID=UPI0035BC41F4
MSELVGRDSFASWLRSPPAVRATSRVRIDTIEDAGCGRLFTNIAAGNCSAMVWNLAPPRVLPAPREIPPTPRRSSIVCRGGQGLPPAFGAAARCDAAAAVHASVCEAAQSRAELLAGARDDIVEAQYDRGRHLTARIETFGFLPAERRFRAESTADDARIARRSPD